MEIVTEVPAADTVALLLLPLMLTPLKVPFAVTLPEFVAVMELTAILSEPVASGSPPSRSMLTSTEAPIAETPMLLLLPPWIDEWVENVPVALIGQRAILQRAGHGIDEPFNYFVPSAGDRKSVRVRAAAGT